MLGILWKDLKVMRLHLFGTQVVRMTFRFFSIFQL